MKRIFNINNNQINKSGFFQNIKLTVFIGYIILFLLTMFGGFELYRQLLKFSNKDYTFAESKQLTLISNALVALYETESMKKVMLSADFRGDLLDAQYKNQNNKIHSYLDSLYHTSNDKALHLSLDTVNILLDAKEQNLSKMMLLTDSIKKLPYSKKILTTILSKNDINGLYDIFEKKFNMQVTDSSFYEKKKKKGFLAKLKDVFTDAEDSTKIIAKQNILNSDTTFKKPVDLLTDTVVQYINDVSLKSDRKKAVYLAKLSMRQEEMLYYDGLLTYQIQQILRNLETKERKFEANLLKEKGKTIKKSSRLVSFISLASLFTLIIFLVLSLMLIDKSQDYKNKLEKSKQFAEDLSKSRERLLLMISHDVKSPLSSIIGHIELLSKEKMPETEKTYVENMRNSSEHILELVNKLMDYHKLEQGKSEINAMAFSPSTLIEDIFNGFVPSVASKKIKYSLKNTIDKKITTQNDPYIIRQIVNNLISNAIKFTKTGSIVLTSTINNDGNLQISVKDTGIGIKKDEKEKIFDEFQRLGNVEQQRNIDGFGLGLAITYKLVHLLEGTIKLESEFGKGSEFVVSLPLKSVEKTPSNSSKIEITYPQKLNKINLKVLFIDDDVTMLNVYKKLLEHEGANVTVCSNSKEVLSILTKNKFDTVLTDIQMPQMNGFELIEKIRKNRNKTIQNLPVVALSARSDISESKYKEAGFTGFLSKPVPFNSLLNKICETVNCNTQSNVPHSEILVKETKGIHSLIEFVEDDKETALDILNVFLFENNIKINELSDSLKTKHWEQIISTSHKLLPLMKMVGAKDIVDICIDLENGEKDEKKVKKLIELVKDTNKEIEKFIENKYPEIKK